MVFRQRIALSLFALASGAMASPALADGGQTGIASYYWQGQGTASGERFNPNALTAAHRSLPFGTKVQVTNLRNGKTVVVRINDRGPFIRGRIIDVSRAAAGELGFHGRGLTNVSVKVLGRPAETVVAEADEKSLKPRSEKKAETAGRTRVASAEPVAPAEPETTQNAGGWTLVPAPSAQVQANAEAVKDAAEAKASDTRTADAR